MTTLSRKRSLAAAIAPALLALSLTACGGGSSGAPDDASKGDFCDAYNADESGDIDTEASPEDQAKAFKDQLDKATAKLEEVGTPSDISDDDREGFEIFLDAVSGLSQDDIQKAIEDNDFESLDGGASGDDKDKVSSFTAWADDYCG